MHIKTAVESSHCRRRSRDGIYSAIEPNLLDAKWRRNRGGWISEGGEGKVDRCQMPCSQWDARRPGSEDVRVIGPLLRFRLLRPRGTRFGGLTEPVLSLQWKRPSWCRRGATDYRLACRSPSPRPSPHRPLSHRASRGPATRHHLVPSTRVACRA